MYFFNKKKKKKHASYGKVKQVLNVHCNVNIRVHPVKVNQENCLNA